MVLRSDAQPTGLPSVSCPARLSRRTGRSHLNNFVPTGWSAAPTSHNCLCRCSQTRAQITPVPATNYALVTQWRSALPLGARMRCSAGLAASCLRLGRQSRRNSRLADSHCRASADASRPLSVSKRAKQRATVQFPWSAARRRKRRSPPQSLSEYLVMIDSARVTENTSPTASNAIVRARRCTRRHRSAQHVHFLLATDLGPNEHG